jgi:Zn-dependent protease
VFLAEPPRTSYDAQFSVFGFPVRVTPFFWLVAALLGYEIATNLHDDLQASSPGAFVLLAMWILAVFVSILIHELGHAFAMQHYGQHASIILYHFGGLASAGAYSSFARSGRFGRSQNQIVISLAGPGAQLLLAAVIVFSMRMSGYRSEFWIWPIDDLLPPAAGQPLPSRMLDVMLFFLVSPSIFWALLNLLPIFPLDGGYVSREFFIMLKGSQGVRDSLVVSLVTAVLAAVYLYSNGSMFNALLFISLAVSSYQLLQMTRFGGGMW